MAKWLSIIIPFFLSAYIYGQCSCTDCPVNLPEFGNVSSSFTINGASNQIMGENGQYLRAVSLQLKHDAIDELDIELIAPNGSSLSLSTYQGIQISQNITFELCFVACNENAEPDPGFPAVFESDAGYEENGYYNGSYYPAVGCLENLTGNINGSWTLDITDNFVQDGGTLLGWSLEFADNDGLSCVESCLPPLCQAAASQIGQLTDTFCKNDPALNFNMSHSYSGAPPDPLLFDYTYVIVDSESGVILNYTTEPNLSTYPAGTYKIYGLSYETIDLGLIPQADGNYKYSDLVSDIFQNEFCAQLSGDSYLITIIEAPSLPQFNDPSPICSGDSILYSIENYDPTINYTFQVSRGAHQIIETTDSTLLVQWNQGPGDLLLWASNDCDTIFSFTSIEIIQAQEISISGPRSVCPNDTVIYTLPPLEDSLAQYEYEISGGQVVRNSNDSISIHWDHNTSNNSICINVYGAACPPTTECITVDVADTPTLKAIVPPVVCQFDTVSSYVQADSNILTYHWSGYGIQIVSGEFTDTVTYVVDNADSASICIETTSSCDQSGQLTFCAPLNVTPKPTVDIISIQSACEKTFTLGANTDSGNILLWEQIQGPSTATINSPDEATTKVDVDSPGIYTFRVEVQNGNCFSYDTVDVEIHTPPIIQNLLKECDLHSYQLTFNIEGGTPPFTVNGMAINERSFTSDAFPSGEYYSFIVRDNNDCSDQVNGLLSCPCASDAGTMSTDTLMVCAASGEVATASFDQNALRDFNDTMFFALHTEAGPTLGTVIDMNTTGEFAFQQGMDYNMPYYISRVVGNELKQEIDLTDTCLSVAMGQVVIFYNAPELSIDPVEGSCDKSIQLTSKPGPDVQFLHWKQLRGPEGSEFQEPHQAITDVFLPIAGDYVFELTAKNNVCESREQVDLSVNDPPEIKNVQKDCIDPDWYTLRFEVEGESEDYEVNVDGSWAQSVFTSLQLPTDTTVLVRITDKNDCSTTLTIKAVDCSCKTEAGDFTASKIELCEGDELDPEQLKLTGSQLEEEDTILYVLHDGTSDSVGNILLSSFGSPIEFIAPIQTGEWYFISALAGGYQNGEMNLNDPCMDQAHGTKVIWNARTEVFIQNEILGCQNVPVSLLIRSRGTYPMRIQLTSDKGRVLEKDLQSPLDSLLVNPAFDEEVWTLDTVFSSCYIVNSEQFILKQKVPEVVEFYPTPSVCPSKDRIEKINLNTLFLKDQTITGNWSSDELTVMDGNVTISNIDTGTYSLYFETENWHTPCDEKIYEVYIHIENCECPDVELPKTLSLCNSTSKVELDEYFEIPVRGTWNIDNYHALTNPPVLNGSTLILSDVTEGQYMLSFDVEQENHSQCNKVYEISLEVEHQKFAGTQTSVPFYCQGEEMVVDLPSLLSNEDPDGVWSYGNRMIPATINIDTFEPGIQEFHYAFESTGVCENTESTVRIEVNPQAEAEIITKDVKCAGDQNGEIEIHISDEDYGPYTYLLNNVTYEDNIIDSLSPGQYKLLARNRNGCSSKVHRISISAPLPLELDLGSDIMLEKPEEVTIEAELNIPDSEVKEMHWTLSGEPMVNEALHFSHTYLDNALIAATVIDKNGCSDTDEVNILVKKNTDIYIPNVFNPNSQQPENRKFGISHYEHIREVKSFRIYDRWGNSLFSRSNFQAGSSTGYWDGTVNGQMMSAGVYIYSIHYITTEGKERTLHGDVTLLF